MSEEKRVIPDGEPVDMSKVTLGPRYGSEDMYRDYPDLKPGSRIAVEKDGVIYTDTISEVTYTSPEAAIWSDPTWWQSLLRHHRLRRIVPASWRKPLQPIRPPKPATVQIGTLGDRKQRFDDKINDTLAALLKPEEKP
jgi:hypothetical protein